MQAKGLSTASYVLLISAKKYQLEPGTNAIAGFLLPSKDWCGWGTGIGVPCWPCFWGRFQQRPPIGFLHSPLIFTEINVFARCGCVCWYVCPPNMPLETPQRRNAPVSVVTVSKLREADFPDCSSLLQAWWHGKTLKYQLLSPWRLVASNMKDHEEPSQLQPFDSWFTITWWSKCALCTVAGIPEKLETQNCKPLEVQSQNFHLKRLLKLIS